MDGVIVQKLNIVQDEWYKGGNKFRDNFPEEISNSELSPVEKSNLANYSSGLYRETGDNTYALKYIKNLKQVILDPEQSNVERAKRLNDLATIFCGFGRDESTMREIFKDEPFSKFWVEGDGALSAKKLLEWSYEEFGKRPMSAIFLSRWYVNRNLVRNLDKKTIDENNKMAIVYLREADNLVKQEILKDKNFYYTYEYGIYMFWKPFIVTGLKQLDSKIVLDKSQELYTYPNLRKYYKDIVKRNNLNSSTNFNYSLLITSSVLDAYFGYKENKNKEEAIKKLDEAIGLMRNDIKLDTNGYIEFMSDSANAGPESGTVVKATLEMGKLYPTFGLFMEERIKEHVERKKELDK